jgi:hypothetical protein
MGMDGVADLLQGQAGADHHDRLTDEGVGVVGEEVDADDAVGGREQGQVY